MWLFSKSIDLLTLYLPVWICWAVLCCLPIDILQADIPLWIWVLFVLCIDVGHVWSTIFRTYLDRDEFGRHKLLLIIAPLFSFVTVVCLAWYSTFWFWRLLAYLAVFHFIKQQYGFLALYKAKAKDFQIKKIFGDKWVLYFATLYPVLYWHLAEGINFSWFVAHDFVNIATLLPTNMDFVFVLMNGLYWVVIAAWLVEEIKTAAQVNLGKILWVLTTAINWYGGIVYFNSDLAFTVTNVVAHGIPYLTLIIYYQYKKQGIQKRKKRPVFYWIALILPIVFLLGWLEEYFWDMLVYGDRPQFFGAVIPYTFSVLEQPLAQAIAIALLTLPQMTHYIIDGFIWKSNEKNPYVKEVFR